MEGKLEATRGAAAAGRHATAAFGEALARVFGVEQCVELRDSVSSRDERELVLAVVADSGEAAVFGFDKAGAARLLTTLLRSGALAREAVTQNPPALEQALGAALAREAAVALGVAVRYDPAALRRRWTHRAEAWVHLDDGLTRVALSVALPEEPLLAGSRLLLPIIVALSAAPRAELARLAPGDLWLPDSGWLLSPERLGERSALEGRALLGAPSGAEGLWLVLSGETALVTGPRVGLDAVCGLDVR